MQTLVEKLKKHGTPCNRNGESHLSGIKGEAKLIRAKIEGTELHMTGLGTAVIVLPEGTRPGQGGGVVWEDDDGQFRTSVVMPGKVSAKDF